MRRQRSHGRAHCQQRPQIEDADNFAVPAPTAQRSFALRCRFRLRVTFSSSSLGPVIVIQCEKRLRQTYPFTPYRRRLFR